ncbi:pentapeptide repeat-containing protein [Nocardia sp. CA-128927]|uniref:pentapeptide repeat-containing protein n=1 Tax=Nocardia sp. CA-128927 TaxID=3239975 RepID=UPI003D968BFE
MSSGSPQPIPPAPRRRSGVLARGSGGLRRPSPPPAGRWRRVRHAAQATFGWAGWGRVGSIGTGVAAVAVAIAAVAGLWFTNQSLRATRDQYGLSEQGQVADRFSRAVEHLGSSAVETQLGGIYSLERLARDSPPDRATIFEVLSAFVRTHPASAQTCGQTTELGSSPNPGSTAPIPATTQAALTVIGRGNTRHDNNPIDLTDTCLAYANLRGANLYRATLTYSNLSHAALSCPATEKPQCVDLSKANLFGANLIGAKLGGADLTGALLVGADLTDAELTCYFGSAGAACTSLAAANLVSANLSRTDLAGADLSIRDCMSVKLPHSQMSLPLCSLSSRTVAIGSRVTVAAGKSPQGASSSFDEATNLVSLLSFSPYSPWSVTSAQPVDWA